MSEATETETETKTETETETETETGTGTATGWAPLRGVRAAFTFLTRVPVGGFPYREADWRWSSAHFPLVGATIGGAMAGVWGLTAGLGAWPSAILALVASLLVTGGFHEDGLADTADALGGAYDRARILEILKDSRIGAFGGLALVTTLLLRASLLAEMGTRAGWLVPAALVASQCVSRVPPIVLMAMLPYATPQARSKSRDVHRAGAAQATVALVWAAIALTALIATDTLPLAAALIAVVASAVAGLVCGWRFYQRLGGVTGDFLGATQQVAEVAILIAILAAA